MLFTFVSENATFASAALRFGCLSSVVVSIADAASALFPPLSCRVNAIVLFFRMSILRVLDLL